LLLRRRDIQVPNKNVSHEFTLFSIFPKSRNQERTAEFQKAISTQIAFRKEVTHSERPDILSLPALGALRNVELHGLPLLEAPETTGLNCREMHKNILVLL
jgi:hypothetical protein